MIAAERPTLLGPHKVPLPFESSPGFYVETAALRPLDGRSYFYVLCGGARISIEINDRELWRCQGSYDRMHLYVMARLHAATEKLWSRWLAL